MTKDEKLSVIRKLIPGAPDIYATPGFAPDGITGAPEYLWVFPWEKVCITPFGDFHDWMYYVGGTSDWIRKIADMVFRWMLEQIASLYDWFNGWRIRRIARFYYDAVRVCGRFHFNWSGTGEFVHLAPNEVWESIGGVFADDDDE